MAATCEDCNDTGRTVMWLPGDGTSAMESISVACSCRTCDFCLEPWADHSDTERKSCELDLQAMEGHF